MLGSQRLSDCILYLCFYFFPLGSMQICGLASKVLLSRYLSSIYSYSSPSPLYFVRISSKVFSCKLIILQILLISSPFCRGVSYCSFTLGLSINKIIADMERKLKTCIVGDSEVGKTSIIIRIIENSFKQSTMTTVGVDYKYHQKQVLGEKVGVELWDTSGQDRFRSVAKNFFRNSDAIFLAFSLTSQKSVESLLFWANELKQNLDPNVPRMIFGNKCDINNQLSGQAQKIVTKLCSEEKYEFVKVSAKTGENIKDAYQKMLEQALKYRKKLQPKTSVILPKQKEKPEAKGCC